VHCTELHPFVRNTTGRPCEWPHTSIDVTITSYFPPSPLVLDNAEVLRFGNPGNPDLHRARDVFDMSELQPERARDAMEQLRIGLGEGPADKVRSYTPQLPKAKVAVIRQFVEDAVTLAQPLTKYSAETLMRPVMHFVYWCVFVLGHEPTREIFEPETVQAYIDEAIEGKTDGTRRNYRAWIIRVAEVVNPDRNPIRSKPLNGRGMEPPYTADDMVILRRWSEGQSTQYRRNGAQTLIALGAGAGLSAIEIAHLRRDWVELHPDGAVEVHVHIDGDFKRSVIVASPFDSQLAELVSPLDGNRMVFLTDRTRTVNDVVSAFTSKLAVPPGTPPVTVRRLRNTWLVNHLTNRIDVSTLMRAAGLESLESISRLALFVPDISDADRIAQLRGI
jgi:hypothetical protein